MARGARLLGDMTISRGRGGGYRQSGVWFGPLWLRDVSDDEMMRGLLESDLFGHPYDEDACMISDDFLERF